MADDEPKGAAKAAVAMSALRSSSSFPVSDAANIATPVSRKHSLGDRILPFSCPLQAEQDTCFVVVSFFLIS